MPNQKYDQFSEIDWVHDHILAVLIEGATFDATQTKLSEVKGPRIRRSVVPGRVADDEEGLLGLPVTFPQVGKDVDYQMLFVKDEGSTDPLLMAFFDADTNGGKLRMTNNGTLIVRPVVLPEGEPPTIGVWFPLEA